MTFEFEKLEIYARVLDLYETCIRIANQAPRGYAHLADQLRRASSSLVLNLAEGAAEFSRGEKSRFYRMARRSGGECAAVLDLLSRHPNPIPNLEKARKEFDEIAAILTALIK